LKINIHLKIGTLLSSAESCQLPEKAMGLNNKPNGYFCPLHEFQFA
jgi:hypothetical protein